MTSVRATERVHSMKIRACSSLLAIIVVLAIIGAAAKAEEAPDIADTRLLRTQGEYDLARRYLKDLLADTAIPDEIRRQAHNELVTIALLTGDLGDARSAALKALMEFPDLTADPHHHPAEIGDIYENLRQTMFGRVSLFSDPPACTVYLDGTEIGTTPLAGIYIPDGYHTIRFRKISYGDEELLVAIEPGGESEHSVVLRPYRAATRLALGVEFGLSLVSLNYDGGFEGQFLGLVPVEEQESAARLSVGAFLHVYRRDRLAAQAGLRYVSCGNKFYFSSAGGDKTSPCYSHFRYLFLPVSLRLYVLRHPRLFALAGLDFGFLLGAELEYPAPDRETDIKDMVQGSQIALTFGGGYEIEFGSHSVMLSVCRTMGMLSLRKSTVWNQIDFTPREWRFAASFIHKL